jgi:DNA-binding MurR/RpiR family transcriptional regulator
MSTSSTDTGEGEDPVPAAASGLQEWLRERLTGRAPSQSALKVLRALTTHPHEMSYASTAEAAALAGVNVASVVRAAQLLGLTGWPALRAEARSRYLAGLSASEVLSAHAAAAQSPAWGALRGDLRNLRELAQVLDDAQVERVAQLLHDAKATLVLGSGSFAAPGLQLAHIAQTVGYDVRLQREGGTALLNAVSLLGRGDCLVVFSLWRSPREIFGAARVAAAREVKVVLVSDQSSQELLDLADELVLVPSEGASMVPSLTASVTVVHAILAALIALDEPHARQASDHAEGLWTSLGLFDPLRRGT